jgi:hypothetical protein
MDSWSPHGPVSGPRRSAGLYDIEPNSDEISRGQTLKLVHLLSIELLLCHVHAFQLLLEMGQQLTNEDQSTFFMRYVARERPSMSAS